MTPTQPVISQHQIQKLMKDMEPDVWKRATRRQYREPAGYPDYQSFIAQAMMISIYPFVDAERKGQKISSSAETEIITFMAVSKYVSAQYPAYWIDEKILPSLLNTDLPENTLLETLKFPFDSFSVLFPNSVGIPGICKRLDWMVVSKINAGEKVDGRWKNFPTAAPSETDKENALVVIYFHDENNVSQKLFLNYPLVGNIPTYERVQSITDDDAIPYANEYEAQLPMRLLVNVLLMTTEYKKYNEEPTRLGKSLNAHGEKVPLWSPRWVGRNYSVKTQPRNPEGHGSSKRPHWRRGHWKNQAVGKDWTEHRMTWIEPYWIG